MNCKKCKYYCRIVDYSGKTVGRVCNLWLDGIIDSDGWTPSERCFEKRSKNIKFKIEEFDKLRINKN